CIELKKIGESDKNFIESEASDFKKAKKEWRNSHWNASVVTLGSGLVLNSKDNKWSTLNTQLFKNYINGKCKAGEKTQFTYLATFGIPQNDSTNDSTVTRQYFLGGRFLAGNSENRFSFDLGFGQDIAKKS